MSNGHIFSFKSASKCISENGLWQWFKALFPSAVTSHHNAGSNQVTLHLSVTNNLVTTKWIAINLSIRIYNFISTIFLNWLHYFEEQLSFILSFGGQMCTTAGSCIHNRKPYFNFTVVSRISLLNRLLLLFFFLTQSFACSASVEWWYATWLNVTKFPHDTQGSYCHFFMALIRLHKRVICQWVSFQRVLCLLFVVFVIPSFEMLKSTPRIKSPYRGWVSSDIQ